MDIPWKLKLPTYAMLDPPSTEINGSVSNYINKRNILSVWGRIKNRGKEEKICMNHIKIAFLMFDFSKRFSEQKS